MHLCSELIINCSRGVFYAEKYEISEEIWLEQSIIFKQSKELIMENSNSNANPATVVGNVQAVQVGSKPMLKSSSSIFYESFYFQDYYDDSLIKKFIKSTERMIRMSLEYSQYISMIKTNYTMMGFDNVLSHIDSSDAEIEFHHYPFSLYDIVDIVMSYHLAKQ
jgi:hypothetical protein